MGVWQYIFAGLGVLLLTVNGWQQYKRSNKKNLALRLLACLLAITGLTCLGLNITYKKAAAAGGIAILITNGYSADSVHAFEQAENKVYPSHTFSEYITNDINTYKTLHVFGYGLSSDELQQLHNASIIFHSQNVSAGIVHAEWQPTIIAGEKLRIQGSYNNTTGTPAILQLNGLNTLFDSVTIRANGKQNFELSTTPRQQGKAVYNLTALSNNKVIEEEPVPFEVQPHDTLSVLILASSPNFENKFLKNWLADNQYQVSIRSTTSKDKFSNDFINTPKTDLQQTTSGSLAKYDILISDAAELAALNKDGQYAVQSAVENGLGLVITVDTTLPHSFYSSYFTIYSGQAKPQTLHVSVADGSTQSPLPTQQPLYIRRQAGLQAIAADSAQQLLAGIALYGTGKIAVTTLSNTYNWMLTGDKDSYQNYWSTLLSKVVTNKSRQFTVRSSPALPVLNQPLHITVQGEKNQPLFINNTPVYLAQNALMPYEWNGNYWPVQTGWQTIKQAGDSSNFYVYANTDWQYMQAVQNTSATKQYASQHPGTNNETSNLTIEVPVNKLYFIIVFIAACIFLWIERKFNG